MIISPLLGSLYISESADGVKVIKEFDNIAQLLLNESVLTVKAQQYRLVEIEFYYYNESIHPDSFTHKSLEQQAHSQWYLHRYHRKSLVKYEIIQGGFKSGKHKGLDITFGDKKLNTYGGILLRGIVSLSGGDYISGPCRVVNKIMENIGIDEKNMSGLYELLKEKNITNVDQPIYISPSVFEQRDISKKPRVGLTNKMNDTNKAFFISKPYNYFISPFKT